MKTIQRTMKRDTVISVVDGYDLVGVYMADEPDNLLAEMSPDKADKIIKLWNE